MDSSTGKKISLLIPTYNAGVLWNEVLMRLSEQNFNFYRKVVIDSGSADDTVKLALQHGFEVINISKEQFNHGATRQLLVDSSGDTEIAVFLTQDAIPASNDSIANLVLAFNDPSIGLAYGRQLPHVSAKSLESHARLFNYPPKTVVRSYQDKDQIGFKVFFCSNSFAAYNVKALMEVGGFPSDSIMGEDALVSARMLLKGYKVAYISEATVYHSHSYTLGEEFRRYFDTRVFHEQNKWLIESYGKPTGEGMKYVRSELKFAVEHDPISVFKSINSIIAKWLGYTSGKFYRSIPPRLLKKLSMHSTYWK